MDMITRPHLRLHSSSSQQCNLTPLVESALTLVHHHQLIKQTTPDPLPLPPPLVPPSSPYSHHEGTSTARGIMASYNPRIRQPLIAAPAHVALSLADEICKMETPSPAVTDASALLNHHHHLADGFLPY